mmetsp:Transcript_10864/g.15925  ORF Transcript_10864/g.15925 Transcript_10864/m.15925 type:complete len:1223 (+) Transcript_10864:167-3835(+)
MNNQNERETTPPNQQTDKKSGLLSPVFQKKDKDLASIAKKIDEQKNQEQNEIKYNDLETKKGETFLGRYNLDDKVEFDQNIVENDRSIIFNDQIEDINSQTMEEMTGEITTTSNTNTSTTEYSNMGEPKGFTMTNLTQAPTTKNTGYGSATTTSGYTLSGGNIGYTPSVYNTYGSTTNKGYDKNNNTTTTTTTEKQKGGYQPSEYKYGSQSGYGSYGGTQSSTYSFGSGEKKQTTETTKKDSTSETQTNPYTAQSGYYSTTTYGSKDNTTQNTPSGYYFGTGSFGTQSNESKSNNNETKDSTYGLNYGKQQTAAASTTTSTTNQSKPNIPTHSISDTSNQQTSNIKYGFGSSSGYNKGIDINAYSNPLAKTTNPLESLESTQTSNQQLGEVLQQATQSHNTNMDYFETTANEANFDDFNTTTYEKDTFHPSTYIKGDIDSDSKSSDTFNQNIGQYTDFDVEDKEAIPSQPLMGSMMMQDHQPQPYSMIPSSYEPPNVMDTTSQSAFMVDDQKPTYTNQRHFASMGMNHVAFGCMVKGEQFVSMQSLDIFEYSEDMSLLINESHNAFMELQVYMQKMQQLAKTNRIHYQEKSSGAHMKKLHDTMLLYRSMLKNLSTHSNSANYYRNMELIFQLVQLMYVDHHLHWAPLMIAFINQNDTTDLRFQSFTFSVAYHLALIGSNQLVDYMKLYFDQAKQKVASHSNTYKKLVLAETLICHMPFLFANQDVADFSAKFEASRREFVKLIHYGTDVFEPAFIELLEIMAGNQQVITKRAQNWMEYLGGYLLYINPLSKRMNVKLLATLKATYYDDAKSGKFLLRFLFVEELEKALSALYTKFDPFAPAMLADILTHAARVSPHQFTAGDLVLFVTPVDGDTLLRETYLLEFATFILTSSLQRTSWPIAFHYLQTCPVSGFAYIRELIVQLPLNTWREVEKIVHFCKKHKLADCLKIIHRTYGMQLLHRGSYAAAMHQFIVAEDEQAISQLAMRLCSEYIQAKLALTYSQQRYDMVDDDDDSLLEERVTNLYAHTQSIGNMVESLPLFSKVSHVNDAPPTVQTLRDSSTSHRYFEKLTFLHRFMAFEEALQAKSTTRAINILCELLALYTPLLFRHYLLSQSQSLLSSMRVSQIQLLISSLESLLIHHRRSEFLPTLLRDTSSSSTLCYSSLSSLRLTFSQALSKKLLENPSSHAVSSSTSMHVARSAPGAVLFHQKRARRYEQLISFQK